MRHTRAFAVLIVSLLATGCIPPTDYSAYLRHMPKSVLVLPPLNQTTEVLASDAFLSTVTSPLAESGYYVFPVAVVDRFLKENGMPTPGEMHQVPLEKFDEVFGADAVLYVVIKDWQTEYIVVSSRTVVTLEYRLVDVKTGAEVWKSEQTVVRGQGGFDYAGIIKAAIHAVTSAASDEARKLAVYANEIAFLNPKRGLLKGYRHPGFEEDQTRARIESEKAAQKK